MLRNILVCVLLGFGLLFALDRNHRGSKAPVKTVGSSPVPVGTSGPTTAPARVTVGPLPNVLAATTGTPSIDIMARLSIRRRIDREGSRVYLDSLFSHTDSTIVRWFDQPANVITVGFIPDTAVAGWNAAVDDARAGMRQWDGNESGLSFREATNPDSANIRVHWTVSLTEPGQLGVTQLNWGPDGVAHTAEITLALHRSTDTTALPSNVRQRVAAHEFGHALGLPHSGSSEDLMFPTSPVPTPSRRDHATLSLLYAVPPGPLRIPQ